MIAWQLVSAVNWQPTDDEVLVKTRDDAVCTARRFRGSWWVTYKGEAVRSATEESYIQIDPVFWMKLDGF